MDKHSSLLQKSVNYGQKKFYNIDTWSPCVNIIDILFRFICGMDEGYRQTTDLVCDKNKLYDFVLGS
jgi:hypothetical protein